MNGNFIQIIIQRIKSIKLNQNLLVFGFFLLISSIFWFFNALNKEYYAELQVPITYINMPENKLVAGPLASKVNVKITAFGYQIMNYKTSSIKPAIINLGQHSLHPVENARDKRFYILTSTLKEEISNVLGPDAEIKNILPDSLIFNLEAVISKRVPVHQRLNLQFKKQYMLKGALLVKPDSVKIKGVKSILDTINQVYTELKEITEIDDSLNIMLRINKIPGTEILPEMVNCAAQVEKFTELTYDLPIEVLNVPEGVTVKLFPAEAKIICNVGFSMYQYIFKEQFRLVTDFNENINNENSRLRLKLIKMPENISNVRVNPPSVDYIIEKND